jgi:hypothetical protein
VVTEASHDRQDPGRGRVLGWISGLGILAVPWVVAGVVSTFLPEPETAFPWAFAVALCAMVVWIVYGVLRIPRFARGAVIGTAIVIGIVAAVIAAVRFSG